MEACSCKGANDGRTRRPVTKSWKSRRLSYSGHGGASRFLSRQCSVKVRPVNVITLSGSTTDRPSLQAIGPSVIAHSTRPTMQSVTPQGPAQVRLFHLIAKQKLLSERDNTERPGQIVSSTFCESIRLRAALEAIRILPEGMEQCNGTPCR
jgi:hypothetical protein